MRQPADQHETATGLFEWLAIFALLGYVCREPFAGAVQFYLSQLNAGFLWFIPDAIGLACVVAVLVIDLARYRSVKFLMIMVAVSYYMLLAYITIGSFAAALSGFKALLPLFAGLLVTRQVLQRRFVQAVLVSLLLLAAFGIWWSTFSALPWSTLNFDSGLGQKQFKGTVWESGGGYRPFGFAADQHSAGSTVVFLLALVGARKGSLMFYFLSLPAGLAVFMSTSRTSLLAFFILVGLRMIFDFVEKRRNAHLVELVTAAVPFLVILVPIAVMVFAQAFSRSEVPTQLISLWVRGSEVYWRPFDFMPTFAPNAWFFGFGLGGVGFPILQSDYSSYYATVDNFLLFGYYSFGVPFLIFYVSMCIGNRVEPDFYKRILFCAIVVFGQFILGWATGLFMLTLGYAASSAFLRGASLRSPTLIRSPGF